MNLEHWESYYRGGALVSCPMGLEPGYTGEVRDAWVTFFATLPDGARVLDIGTGNGAVALIAKETAATLGRSFEIHGVDLARVDPVRHVPNGATLLAGIEFHPGVPAEQLPFEANGFDAVSGQYALEWGLVGFSKSLADELRGTGLTSVAILPGSVDTDMLIGSGFTPQMSADDVASLIVHAGLDAPAALTGSAIEMFG